MARTIIAPSLLSGDFGRLAEDCKRMLDLGADWLHMDVMDGHFVPNLTIGAPVIKSLRKHTKGFLDCHLMVSNPQQWVKDYKDAGADMFTFHIEANGDHHETTRLVKEAGMKVGMAIKPKTPVESVLPYADTLDMILIMTVEPGFGGQSFMADQMPKVKFLRERFPTKDIQVDGGLAMSTIHAAAEAGANVIVAGSSVFGAPDPGQMIADLRKVVDEHAAKRQS